MIHKQHKKTKKSQKECQVFGDKSNQGGESGFVKKSAKNIDIKENGKETIAVKKQPSSRKT